MSEIRKDPASHTWIVLATERGKRPSDFREAPKTKKPAVASGCPFCGEGEMTVPPKEFSIWPGEIDKKTGKWLTRVLPNRFPALKASLELTQGQADTVYHFLSGVGGHDILVDSPKHNATLANMNLPQLRAVIRTYLKRYLFWKNDPRIVYALIFRNYGVAAGASLDHPHSQLIATPVIPPRIFEELREAREYYKANGECLFCRMIKAEYENERTRLVYENRSIIAFCPFAARFPYETWILPKAHRAVIEGMPVEEENDLAEALSQVFKRINALLNDPPYNYILHVAPLRTPGLLYYHWHIEVLPRLTRPAGFEFGGGIFINTVSPEDAARDLRELKLKPSR